jgi:pimeloyl-ACP methyl ester carboxylesterase
MTTVDALRTPDDRFDALPGWTYEPRYIDDLPGYEGLRMAVHDEGPRSDAPVFLCLHGEPSWSYLYRKMAPVFLAAGARVVMPDLFGFGRSDKPVDDSVYTFHWHRNSLKALIERLDLTDICLVCQDWGGLLGLTLPMDYPDRFTRLIVMNTGIGIGKSPGEGFEAWREYARTHPDMDVGALLKRSTAGMSDGEANAYAAPFPDERYKAGVRRFPAIVPTDPDMEGVDTGKKALKFWSQDWSGESLMAIGMQDPVLGPAVMESLRSVIRNCPEPMKIEQGGHFVQEHGEPIAREAVKRFGLA